MSFVAGFLSSQGNNSANTQSWVSGQYYLINQNAISPINNRVYTRKIAGAGNIDPSSDAVNWKISNRDVTKSIITSQSVASFGKKTITPIANSVAVTIVSGSLTAGVYSTVLSINGGGGVMPHLTMYQTDATARTISARVTVDNTQVFNFTSISSTTSGAGIILAGASSSTDTFIVPPIKWGTSLLIEWASSLTESGLFSGQYIYNLEY